MAVRLNGTTDALGAVDVPVVKNVAQATIMAWCRPRGLPTGVAGNPTVIGCSIGPPPGLSGASRLSIDRAAGVRINITIRALDSDPGTGVSTNGIDYTESVWQHVAATLNFTTRTCQIYINGVVQPLFPSGNTSEVVVNSTAGNTSNTNCKGVGIGVNEDFISGFWPGDIEDCRIYSRLVQPNELLTIYSSCGVDGIFDSLEARWPLTGPIGQNVVSCPNISSLGSVPPATVQAGTPVFTDGIISGPRARPRIPIMIPNG